MNICTGFGMMGLRHQLVAMIGIACLGGLGCNSNSSPKNAAEKAVRASEAAGTHIDVLCMMDHINNPAEPFHYSYKYASGARSVNSEAEITPTAMDITIMDESGSHSYHGVHSDETSWNSAVLDLSGLNITAMSARLDSLNGSSAIAPRGMEAMNGYQTTKYVIDTTSANSSDRQQYETLFGKSSFEKGTVWVPEDGCAVKLFLDEGLLQPDGTMNKAHYEMAMFKK